MKPDLKKMILGRIMAICIFTFIAGAIFSYDPAEIIKDKKLDKAKSLKEDGSDLVWFDAKDLNVEGKGWKDTKFFFQRLPSSMEGKVSTQVFDLGKNTAGISIRFITNSKTIGAIWDGGVGMYHMPASGNSGLDLYVKTEDKWKFVGIGRPKDSRTVNIIKSGLSGNTAEYILFLPLYHNVTEMRIGIDSDANIAPAPKRETKPIVFYGTSITQGGCASRTGMCHTNLLTRWLDREIINLGFSGSARMEIELAQIFGELDPSVFVFECLPNMTPELVETNFEPFILKIREAKPNTPILCAENVLESSDSKQNQAFKKAFDNLTKAGVKNLIYVKGTPQLEGEENGTVDGVHPTDVGFLRIANYYKPILKEILDNEKYQPK